MKERHQFMIAFYSLFPHSLSPAKKIIKYHASEVTRKRIERDCYKETTKLYLKSKLFLHDEKTCHIR